MKYCIAACSSAVALQRQPPHEPEHLSSTMSCPVKNRSTEKLAVFRLKRTMETVIQATQPIL